MSERAGKDLWNAGYRAALEEALGYTEVYNLDNADAWERGFAEGCLSCRRDIQRLLDDAQGMPREARRREGGSGPSGLASPVGNRCAQTLSPSPPRTLKQ